MLLKAAAMLEIELARSWIVGDRAGDLAAGRNAGIAGGFHVLTGFGTEERDAALALDGDGFRVLAAPTIRDVLLHLPSLND